MDGNRFRPGFRGHPTSAVLSHWWPRFRILVWPPVDTSGNTGRLLCPVSLCSLGRSGFCLAPLASGQAAQGAFSRAFRSAAGFFRAPTSHQRAAHQFFVRDLAHQTPPLSPGNRLWNSTRGNPLHAGGQRRIQADKPKYAALHRRCGRISASRVRSPLVFLTPFKIAGSAS